MTIDQRTTAQPEYPQPFRAYLHGVVGSQPSRPDEGTIEEYSAAYHNTADGDIPSFLQQYESESTGTGQKSY